MTKYLKSGFGDDVYVYVDQRCCYVRNEHTDEVYCNDGQWRKRPMLFKGAMGVKTWRRPSYAKRAAQDLQAFCVHYLYPGDKLYRDGMVIKPETYT
jgi:hypothetical protein